MLLIYIFNFNNNNFFVVCNENVNSDASTIVNNTPVLSKTQKSPLIQPSEVLVSQSSVLKAEPVITHLGIINV